MEIIKRPSSLFIIISLCIILVRYLLTAFESAWFYELYGYYGQSFIEPVEVVAVTLLIVGIWLAFFNIHIQRKWWRIARWFIGFVVVALGYSLTIPYQGGGFIGFPGMRELMFLWGIVFVGFTIMATLANKL